jgi:transcriptional regulator with XRE-family HTH domain
MQDRLSARLAALRRERGFSLDELAERSGLSRATLSRIERGETSPTAAMLGRLCAVFGWTLSRLMAAAEAEQPRWTDPETGFTRIAVSPPAAGLAMELTQAMLPAGARISYDAAPVPGMEQHIWLQEGALELRFEGTTHLLAPGDCLRLKLTGGTAFHSPGPGPARYLIAICHTGGTP